MLCLSDILVSFLQTIPFYIFSESYGGKMAAAFALSLQKVSFDHCPHNRG